MTREYWLSVERVACSPDGYNNTCLTFNGTLPGPTLFVRKADVISFLLILYQADNLQADWGDTFVIHVTNNDVNNGTSIHWHGMRQLNSVSQDGVPGVVSTVKPPHK